MHSVDKNFKLYTFADKDEYLDNIYEKWDSFNNETRPEERGPWGTSKLLTLKHKKEL